jgi:NADP-reducing hydrogenase subunit HndB
MKVIQSLEDLNRFREQAQENKVKLQKSGATQVIVSLGTCGIAAGALETMHAIQERIAAEKLQNVLLSKTGCSGLCRAEPIVQVITADQRKVSYGNVTPEVARRILQEHVLGGKILQDYVING